MSDKNEQHHGSNDHFHSNEEQRKLKDRHDMKMTGVYQDGTSRYLMSPEDREILKMMLKERRCWPPGERASYPMPANARNTMQGELYWAFACAWQDSAHKVILLPVALYFVVSYLLS